MHLKSREAGSISGLAARQRRERELSPIGADGLKYKALFEGAGVAIWDCDFSAVHKKLEGISKIAPDLRGYLIGHPELLRQCIAGIRVRDVNEHAVTLYHARSKEELKARLGELFPPESERVFAEEFLALYEGKLHFQDHKAVRALDGEMLCVVATVTALPSERPLENVIVAVLDVTEQERAREELKESESRFREIFEQNVVAMNLWDAEGRILRANEAFLRMTGYTQQEVESGALRYEMFAPAADRRPIIGAGSPVLDAHKFETVAHELVSREGARIPVLLSGGSLAGRSGQGVSFFFDLREQERAADAVRKKSAYARLLRDVAVAANAPWEPAEVLLYSLEMLCSELDFPLGHAFLVKDNRLVSSQIWHCAKNQMPRYAEFMVATAELSSVGAAGVVRLALSSDVSFWQWPEETDVSTCSRARAAAKCGIRTMIILPLFCQGELVAVLELGSSKRLAEDDEDLTKILVAFSTELSRVFERRQAQEVLKKREELYRTLVKSFPGGYVVVFDQDLRCVLADGNQLPQRPESAVGKTLGEVIEGDFGSGFMSACLDALQFSKPGNFETVLPDGRVHHVDVVPIGNDGALAMVISHDITVLKSSEQALRDSERQLRSYAERLLVLARRLIQAHEEERTRIARELHDDFNQRIAAACISLSNLLLDSKLKDAKVRRQIINVKEMISELSHDIRSMSHNLHPAVLEHMGITAALRAQCEEFGRLRKLAVTFECDCERLLDRVDSEISICLYRVLQEALTNIRKHSGAGQVMVVVHGDDEKVEMQVHDDGVTFDPVQARNHGLGLTNMEERVKLLNGTFHVFSELNRGNAIMVTIPRHASRSAMEREASAGRVHVENGDKRSWPDRPAKKQGFAATPRRMKKI